MGNYIMVAEERQHNKMWFWCLIFSVVLHVRADPGVSDNHDHGCRGYAKTLPNYEEYRKSSLYGYNEEFEFEDNKSENKREVKFIVFGGTCCWDIFSREGTEEKIEEVNHKQKIHKPQ